MTGVNLYPDLIGVECQPLPHPLLAERAGGGREGGFGALRTSTSPLPNPPLRTSHERAGVFPCCRQSALIRYPEGPGHEMRQVTLFS